MPASHIFPIQIASHPDCRVPYFPNRCKQAMGNGEAHAAQVIAGYGVSKESNPQQFNYCQTFHKWDMVIKLALFRQWMNIHVHCRIAYTIERGLRQITQCPAAEFVHRVYLCGNSLDGILICLGDWGMAELFVVAEYRLNIALDRPLVGNGGGVG